MAINRAPFNALVDDDGSNLVGSLWNKAAIQSVILDPVDAELQGPLLVWTVGAAGIGTVGTGWAVVTGKLIFASATIIVPANSNGAVAEFSLPTPAKASTDHGLVQSYGPVHHRLWISNLHPTVCKVLNGVSGAQRTFQEISGQNFMIHGTYLLP